MVGATEGREIGEQEQQSVPSVGVTTLGLPTRFIPQGKVNQLLSGLGLDADGIAAAIRRCLDR